jgi:hypothetical protein
MFKGFNLSLNKNFSEFKSIGEGLNASNRAAVKKAFALFIEKDGVINGSQLQEYWFPQISADVFISHSHQDRDVAMSFAGWLSKTFQLKPFIDSCVWGYADDLLKQVNDKYCKNSNGKYEYEKIMNSASHVHMMLVSALGTMIDNTECLIFLNTPNSISAQNVISKTQSPWLYMEIATSGIIRRKDPQSHRQIMESAALIRKAQVQHFKVEYDVSLHSLIAINEANLTQWKDLYAKQGKYALDALYMVAK